MEPAATQTCYLVQLPHTESSVV